MLRSLRIRLRVPELVDDQLFVSIDVFEKVDRFLAFRFVEDLDRAGHLFFRGILKRQLHDAVLHDKTLTI